MRKELAYDNVTVPTASLPSNPIPISTASTKLFIKLIYTQGTEDGIQISLEHQDTASAVWETVCDFGGATSPGTNDILPFIGVVDTGVVGTATGYLIPIPQRLVIQGDMRLRLVRDGVVAATGKVTAYLKTGEY